jgi:hypothetical protein
MDTASPHRTGTDGLTSPAAGGDGFGSPFTRVTLAAKRSGVPSPHARFADDRRDAGGSP